MASGGGGSGEKLTLFTPSISFNESTSVLTITDDNGGFVEGYNLYANGELVATLPSKTEKIAEYIEQTETLELKVQAKSANFNYSDFSNTVVWVYIDTDGTRGLAYDISSDGTYAWCSGIGSATESEIIIAGSYEGVPVTTITSEFQRVEMITSVTIPDSVTKISDYGALSRCDNLKSVVCGRLLAMIGSSAFKLCSSLKRIDFSKCVSVPTLTADATAERTFAGTPADLQFKVPVSLYEEWRNATNWCDRASQIVTEFTNEV